MAEEGQDRSREDLTEEASPFRIEESRRKGQVGQSRELAGLGALLAAGVTAYAVTPTMGQQLVDFMRDVFRTDLSSRLDLGSGHILHDYVLKAMHITISIGLPICAAGFVFGALSSFAQIGVIFSTDPIAPDLSKIDPLSGARRVFSLHQGIDGLKLVFKMTVILAIAYQVVRTQVLKAPSLLSAEPLGIAAAYGSAGKVVFLSLIAVLAVFAAIDFWYQKWEFSKNLRMTKQEAKQEHKEREGDPHIKARIRSIQREMARKRMMQAVKKADVIITNPTHIAIAIVYENGAMLAPKIVAKGADHLAQRIKQIASDAGVPLVENVPLARTLYKTVKVGQYVPRALYQAVAEVLAYVYRLKKRGF